MINDTSEAVGCSEQEVPGLILKIVKRNDLNQHQSRAIPFKIWIVAEQLFDF